MSMYVGICIKCRKRKALPNGAMCAECEAANG